MELSGIEAQRSARLRIVAGQAFVLAGVVPDLVPKHVSVPDGDRLVLARFRHQGCSGGRSPSVGQSVDAIGGAYQESGLQTTARFRHAAGEFEFEMLHPHRAGRGKPRGVLGEGHGLSGRQREPTLLDGEVGPERQIHLVGFEGGMGRETRGIRECARLGQGLREGRIPRRGGRQALDLPSIDGRGQEFSIARIFTEGDSDIQGCQSFDLWGAGGLSP